MIYVSDDGTRDTVLCCDLCSKEFRFNYEPDDDDDDQTEDQACRRYKAWVDECIAEVADEHVCSVSDDDDAEEEIGL